MINTAIAYAYDGAFWYNSAVGFSGVLFSLAVDESVLSPFPTRSIFGLFNVPTRLYPWVLMIILSVAFPSISFLGHLSGAVLGLLHAWGWLGWCTPSLVTLRKVEEARWFGFVLRSAPYRMVPGSDPVVEGASARAFARQLGGALACVLRPLYDCLRPCLDPITSRFGGRGSSTSVGSVSSGAAGGGQPLGRSAPAPTAPRAEADGAAGGYRLGATTPAAATGALSGAAAAPLASAAAGDGRSAGPSAAARKAAEAAAARAARAAAANTTAAVSPKPDGGAAGSAAADVSKPPRSFGSGVLGDGRPAAPGASLAGGAATGAVQGNGRGYSRLQEPDAAGGDAGDEGYLDVELAPLAGGDPGVRATTIIDVGGAAPGAAGGGARQPAAGRRPAGRQGTDGQADGGGSYHI
jgi:hypothetical protein